MSGRISGAVRERRRRAWLVVVGVVVGLGGLELIGAIGLHVLKEPPALPAELRDSVSLAGRGDATQPDPYLGYRIRPNLDDERVRTNRYGLRAGPIDAVPSADTLRILLLGGSTAWSYTARNNDETLAVVLERKLAAHLASHPDFQGRRVEVLNAGVPGYVAWQSALSYTLRHRKLAPHAVVSLEGSNDISGAITNAQAGVPMRYFLTRDLYLRERPELWRDLRRWATHRLQRAKLGQFLQQLDPPDVSELGAPAPEEVAAAYGRALEHLAEQTRADGARLLVVLQPVSSLTLGKPLTGFEQAVNAHEDAVMPGRNDYYARSARQMRGVLEELETRPGVATLDGNLAFDGVSRVAFTDPVHLTPIGREHLAAAMLEPLSQLLAP
ncbi:SGNH/GDSL hydrolase family protein [Myxococcota bacterium]|nr:SGNH/GDSL hydrolase family protein [Myxococcota bacterium]